MVFNATCRYLLSFNWDLRGIWNSVTFPTYHFKHSMTNLITRVTYCKDYTFRNINHTIMLYFSIAKFRFVMKWKTNTNTTLLFYLFWASMKFIITFTHGDQFESVTFLNNFIIRVHNLNMHACKSSIKIQKFGLHCHVQIIFVSLICIYLSCNYLMWYTNRN
jgi:hypothetical protein